MEQIIEPTLSLVRPVSVPEGEELRTDKPHPAFIEANTLPVDFKELTTDHIIPVFVKDNEPLISHAEFIMSALSSVQQVFHGEQISAPSIRVSHPVKGRIPDAKDKPANQLEDWERTLYYERLAFIIEVPSIQDTIDGNRLSLTIGGVKSYSSDNLYSRTTSDQHFKIFIGFQNTICCNLCVWTDGYLDNLKVKNLQQLQAGIQILLESYNSSKHLYQLNQLTNSSITEQQFANLVGRCRMYQHLPNTIKQGISPILLGEQQMATVVKDFYKDKSFCRQPEGNINLWRLYNLFTGSNKNSYIDSFLGRSVNAFEFVDQIRLALEDGGQNWYLN